MTKVIINSKWHQAVVRERCKWVQDNKASIKWFEDKIAWAEELKQSFEKQLSDAQKHQDNLEMWLAEALENQKRFEKQKTAQS